MLTVPSFIPLDLEVNTLIIDENFPDYYILESEHIEGRDQSSLRQSDVQPRGKDRARKSAPKKKNTNHCRFRGKDIRTIERYNKRVVDEDRTENDKVETIDLDQILDTLKRTIDEDLTENLNVLAAHAQAPAVTLEPVNGVEVDEAKQAFGNDFNFLGSFIDDVPLEEVESAMEVDIDADTIFEENDGDHVNDSGIENSPHSESGYSAWAPMPNPVSPPPEAELHLTAAVPKLIQGFRDFLQVKLGKETCTREIDLTTTTPSIERTFGVNEEILNIQDCSQDIESFSEAFW